MQLQIDDGSTQVDQEIKQRLSENAQLQDALTDSGLSRRFQAMVLGLATLKQMNDDPPRSEQ